MVSGEAETGSGRANTTRGSWKVMIVDDDQGVHDVTTLALKRFIFSDKPISFYHAYSGQEACQMLEQNPDIALVLLDVVMETEDAGLKTVRFIREQLNNRLVRIVMRTGQPGVMSEEQIIRDYDVNDYRSKSELTIQRLNTLMYAGLRAYRDLEQLHWQRCSLETIANSSRQMCCGLDPEGYVSLLHEGICSILGLDADDENAPSFLLLHRDQDAVSLEPRVLGGRGAFASHRSAKGLDLVEEQGQQLIKQAAQDRQHVIDEDLAVFFIACRCDAYGLVLMTGLKGFTADELKLVRLLAQQIILQFAGNSLTSSFCNT